MLGLYLKKIQSLAGMTVGISGLMVGASVLLGPAGQAKGNQQYGRVFMGLPFRGGLAKYSANSVLACGPITTILNKS